MFYRALTVNLRWIYRSNISLVYLTVLLVAPGLVYGEGNCPQARKTNLAPTNFIYMKNPLPENFKNIKAGKLLYQGKATPIACKNCHGANGDGMGDPSFESNPPSRNFTCAETMEALSDGQLFWIIKNGSKNTPMFSFSDLSDSQTWQLIHYIRQFAK